MSIFQLECFMAVADHLNFAKAAEQMNVSQPAITHQIRTLEEELHTKLFNRTTRMVSLTLSGISFLEDAGSMIQIAKNAQKRFESGDRQEIITLSVGCASPAFIELLPDAIRELVRRHPNLHPMISVTPGIRILDRVEDGTIDLAFTPRGVLKKNSSLTYRELKKAPMVCICPRTHPLSECESVLLADLEASPLILYRPGTVAAEVMQLQQQLLTKKRPSELYFCETGEAAILLAKAGLGIALLPDIYIPMDQSISVIRIRDAEPISVGLYYNRRQQNPLSAEFAKLMAEQFSA